MDSGIAQRLTADDLWRMSHEQPDLHAELIDGELMEMSPSSTWHSVVAARLIVRISLFVEQHSPGHVMSSEAGFRLDDGTVLAPDAAYVSHERLPDMPETGFAPVAPDLAVEVVSPSDRASMIQRKVARYLAAGTRLMWVVYPDTRSVVVHTPDGTSRTLGANDTLDGADVLPGFTLAVADVFPPRGKPAAAPTTDAAADHDGGAS